MAQAQTTSGARLTVVRLLSLYDGEPVSPPLPDWPASVAPRLAREQAGLYIAAVIDEGESRRWCVAQRNLPPHERDAELIKRLRAKPNSQQPNAARALATILSSDFPCSKAKKLKGSAP
ncbi:MAG: Rap1a/Tai family immunity protein [Rhodocyclaceae bacterium]